MKEGWGHLTISTLSPLNVRYHITVDSLNYSLSGTVTKNRPAPYIYLHSPYFQTRSSSFVDRFKGIHVKSDQPISLVFFKYYSYYLVLPCHEYSGVSQYEYYAVSTSSYVNRFLSEVLLVGCSNNTNITIVPSVDLFIPLDAQVNGSVDILVTKGRSHTVTLHEGQTLLLGKGNGSDISGTRIISNKPLTVITGHQCGGTPEVLKRPRCHRLHLQVPPTITWGKRFILTNFMYYHARSLPLSYVKVVTSQADTTVTVHCNGATNTTRYSVGAVGTYHYNITDYCFIKADKPIFVVQFPHSYLYFTSMVLVPPMKQYLQEIEFDLYIFYHLGLSRLVITTSVEGFSPTAILHNGQATLNWTAIYNSSQNIVAYGTEIETLHYGRNRYHTNHLVIHTGKNGKLFVQAQTYERKYVLNGHPAVILLQPSKYRHLMLKFVANINLGVIPVCIFSCGNGNCVSDNLCQCFDGWTGDHCDEGIYQMFFIIFYSVCSLM